MKLSTETTFRTAGMVLFLMASVFFVSLGIAVKGRTSAPGVDAVCEAYPGLYTLVAKVGEVAPAEGIIALGDVYKVYNEAVTDSAGVGPETRERLLMLHPSAFSAQVLTEILGSESPALSTALEYTSWMEGREWAADAYRAAMSEKLDEVNAAIIQSSGIPKAARAELTLSILREAAPGWLRSGAAALILFGLAVIGGVLYALPLAFRKPGIHHNGIFHHAVQTRQWPAWVLFAILTGFYVSLYELPGFLAHQVALVDAWSIGLTGQPAGRWFLYGVLYTMAMLVLGFRVFLKYRGNAYQQFRTGSVLFFQVVFAFSIPQIMTRLHLPAYDLKSAWPLEYSFFFDYRLGEMMQAGTLGLFMLVWGIVLFAAGVPLLTYFFGKRWYCSWVCGCGGLAETVGDPFRHLSDKRVKAWKTERWLVHGVLVFAVVMTAAVLYTSLTGNADVLGVNSYNLRSTYGFFVGFVFAGAVGTGFYPVMGNRVWCRFGCPLAAYLGVVQRFKSRFRITTNGGQCISCGNCSTYCEMGIDVRWYAQRGQNIVRSSCVGCGVCSAVCPRGVLRLENASDEGRIQDNPILIGRDHISLQL